jgi:Xaa-Pro aminopeptidase
MSERELTSLVRACTYEQGAERIKYTGIVAGIDRAPLGGPTDRVWEPGQVLEVDLCPQVRGYFADFCRIYVGGEPTGAQHAAYAALRDATSRQREAVRPGATVREVSRAAAASLGETPYGRNGHGLGLEMPEPPSLTPLDEARLAPGMVICLEPNAYFNEVGWLVGEETVVVREDGCELLSPPWPDEIGVIDRR